MLKVLVNYFLAVIFPIICLQGVFAGPQKDKSGVKASALSLPSGPGSIEGLGESFEPQLNSGSLTYSVAIDLPKGRLGLQPELSISYNSGLGNSFIGIGWDLNLPVIKRQTDKGFPEYNANDTFIFQGEELVPLTDGTWRCENESSFLRFRQIGTGDEDEEPDAWECTGRDGITHIYGGHRTSGRRSVVEHPDKPAGDSNVFENTYLWALDTTVDLHGNRIDYFYYEGEGILYPKIIIYNSRLDKLQESSTYRVEFYYDLERPDVFDDYRSGFSVKIDRRLVCLNVYADDKLVRSYKFKYKDGPSAESSIPLGVSLLSEVIQFDNNKGKINFLPPIRFEYSELSSEINKKRPQSVDLNYFQKLDIIEQTGSVQIVDINADGLPDIYKTNTEIGNRQEAVLNKGVNSNGDLIFGPYRKLSDFSPPDLRLEQTTLTDFDGNGVIDLVHIYNDTFIKKIEVFRNRGGLDGRSINAGFNQNSVEIALDSAPEFIDFASNFVRQFDLNFDKRSDFVRIYPNFPNAVAEGAYLNSDGKWALTKPHRFNPEFLPIDMDFSNTNLRIADMNGDRLQDLVLLGKDENYSGRLKITYWPYCGLGRWGQARIMQPAKGDNVETNDLPLNDVYIEDLSGDGLADLFYLKADGCSSVLTLRLNVAGHKLTDMLIYSDLPRYNPGSSSQPTVFRTADLNGNGSTDLIWRNQSFCDDSWKWLDLMPDAGKPNLLTRIDNGIGKITEIEYGNAHEDYVRALDSGHPWTTKIPFAVQVVRRIRTSSGYDLNGDGREDTYVSEFKYRDGFYDGFEKEFRGFAFAERIDYGDDYLWDENLQVIGRSDGWNRGSTPTRQVSGPTLVTRYRFHTGAADRQDNDEPPAGDPSSGLVDEITKAGGREEEPLKGRQLLEEKVDPWVLHSGDKENDFDAACAKAASGEDLYKGITEDKFVYTRARQFWGIRRLYRPTEKLLTQAGNSSNQDLTDLGDIVQVPAGRFDSIHVPNGVGKSVSFSFVKKIETDIIEANRLLSDTNTLPTGLVNYEYKSEGALVTRKEYDYDDYGNAILERDLGILSDTYDDERLTTTTYSLGGQALDRWIINQPDTVETTDEYGVFVNRTKHYYDGEPFKGLASGMIGSRALLHRVEKFIDDSDAIDEQRLRYDEYGNVVEMRDPNFGTEYAKDGGHRRLIQYDPEFHTYPVKETISVGDGKPDLVMEAGYDYGFGVVTSSTDFNQNLTTYEYDSFGRIVAIVKPGDTTDHPTQLYEYQAYDPHRSLIYKYDREGRLVDSDGQSGPQPGFNAANRIVTRLRETAGTANTYTTAIYTDGMGRTIAEVGEGEEPGTWIVSKATSYNLRGTPSATWLPYQVKSADVPRFGVLWRDGRPPETDGINPSVVRTDVLHDPLGREIVTIQPPETWGGERKKTLTQILPFSKYTYDENDSDPGSDYKRTPMAHFEDGLGRLVKVHEVVRLTNEGERINGENSQVSWETLYSYDLNDKLTRIRDSQGNLKHMEYDGLGRLTYMNDPDRGTMEYQYSPASNLVWTRDAKDQVIEYRYDGVNRILSEDYLDDAGLTPDVTYHYDSGLADLDLGNGQRGTPSNTRGQLVWVEDLAGEEHFSYDARGRLEWQLKRIPDTVLTDVLVAYQTGYSYDSMDRMVGVFYPDSDQVGYTYNSRNLLQSIDGGRPGSVVNRITYRPSGQLDTIVYGNGVVTSYDYDPRLRLRELKTIKADQSYIDFAYIFDPASNITEITDRRDLSGQPDAEKRKNTQKFEYDDLYRLTRVSYPSLVAGNDGYIKYRYDRLGNMLKKESNIPHRENGLSVTHLGDMQYGGSLGSVNRDGGSKVIPGPHALTSVSAEGGRIYPYDANGNMTNIDGLICGWDFKDRMISAENDKMHARYVYDYTDRRVIKSVTGKPGQPDENNTKSTVYVNKYFELRPGEPPVKYVWNGDTRVARITSVLKTTESTKTQRLRLHKGWNLQTLVVDGAETSLIPGSNPIISEAVWWNDSSKSWSSLAASTDELPDYPVIWLHAIENTVLPATGSPLPVVDIQLTPGESRWVPNTSGKSIPLTDFPEGSESWFWDAESQTWRVSILNELGYYENNSEIGIFAGSAAYVNSRSDDLITLKLSNSDLIIRFYHLDHLGSLSVLSDRNGSHVREMANYPYGFNRIYYDNNLFLGYYGYMQKELDWETGFHYVEARYLAANLGVFISVDPLSEGLNNVILGEPSFFNTYSYAIGNPVVYHDKSGLRAVKAIEGGVDNDKSIKISSASTGFIKNYAVDKMKGVIKENVDSIPYGRVVRVALKARVTEEPVATGVQELLDVLNPLDKMGSMGKGIGLFLEPSETARNADGISHIPTEKREFLRMQKRLEKHDQDMEKQFPGYLEMREKWRLENKNISSYDFELKNSINTKKGPQLKAAPPR